MLTTLEREMSASCDVRFLNLTRPADYKAGVLSLANLTRTIADVASVFRAARQTEVTHVHSAFVPAVTIVRAALLLLAARAAGSRAVLHVHGGSLPGWADGGLRRLLVRAAAAPAHAVIAVSDSIAATIRHRRSLTVYNGVDTAVFTPAEREPHTVPVVVFAGLLTRRKGVVDLIEASKMLHDRGVDHQVVIIGGRPDEGDEEERIVRNAAGGREEFLGAVPHGEMPRLLAEADIFCLPSWWEAMPLSILEAMAAGLPVIATTVGQVPDIVGPEVGRLVAPQQPRALADALAELIESEDLRRELGSAARQQALTRYSVSVTVEAIVELLADVARSRRARS